MKLRRTNEYAVVSLRCFALGLPACEWSIELFELCQSVVRFDFIYLSDLSRMRICTGC